MTTASRALLQLDRVTHRYRSATGEIRAVAGVTLEVGEGEFVTMVGPSGSGKSTLLRCAAGLLTPTDGEVRVRGATVDGAVDQLAVVFQEYGRSLFPWLTVRDNVALPLRRRMGAAERAARVEAALAEVGLADAAGLHPWQLSGGMQQRAAIARAIAYQPSILLMDEPFGSVDAQTRADLQDLVLRIASMHSSTVLFVTHDIDEAVYLADRVVVLSPGPGRVRSEIEVDLPRPRDQIETRADARFVELRAAVARLLMRDGTAAR